jgi:hypothetical protein
MYTITDMSAKLTPESNLKHRTPTQTQTPSSPFPRCNRFPTGIAKKIRKA